MLEYMLTAQARNDFWITYLLLIEPGIKHCRSEAVNKTSGLQKNDYGLD